MQLSKSSIKILSLVFYQICLYHGTVQPYYGLLNVRPCHIGTNVRRQPVPLKRSYVSTKLHRFTSHHRHPSILTATAEENPRTRVFHYRSNCPLLRRQINFNSNLFFLCQQLDINVLSPVIICLAENANLSWVIVNTITTLTILLSMRKFWSR